MSVFNTPFAGLGDHETTVYLTTEMMVTFLNENKLMECVSFNSPMISNMYATATPGSIINLRKFNLFTPTRGLDVSSNVNQVTDAYIPIVMQDPFNQALELDLVNERISVGNVKTTYIDPAIKSLSNGVEVDILDSVYSQFIGLAGTPGTAINSAAVSEADAKLDDAAIIASDRCMFMRPQSYAGLSVNNSTLFNEAYNTAALRDNKVSPDGRFFNLDTYKSTLLPAHMNGNWTGGQQIDGANQNVNYEDVKNGWGQTINLKGFGVSDPVAVKRGDKFTIAGVYAINMVTKQVTSDLQVFTIQDDVASDGSGNVTATIYPYIIIDDGNQVNKNYATVSAAPADSAVATLVSGDANGLYEQALVWQRDALVVATADMVKPIGNVFYQLIRDKESGFSITLMADTDVNRGKNNYRLTLLVAPVMANPYGGVVVIGNKLN